MSDRVLKRARTGDLDELLPLVRAYHLFESVSMSENERTKVLTTLLESPEFGVVWLIRDAGTTVGYLALCFGYSIEFQGRDAFVDEFYLIDSARGRGIGTRALREAQQQAGAMGIVALHLEVAAGNVQAMRMYRREGFASRDRFQLMSCALRRPGD